ncbi:MAG: hypothetical protein IH968_04260 [Gemmatimonadetes bacterium]|nr:hypothetical protein [Gemmatimonadota bacterium]
MNEHSSWPAEAERLLESVPGVTSVSLVGDAQAVEEVRILYEPGHPVGEILDAVRARLESDVQARLSKARFHVAVAPRAGDAPRRWSKPPRAAPEPMGRVPRDAAVSLVAHHQRRVRPGIVRFEVQVGCRGRTFSGAVVGRMAPPGGIQIAALATLRALDTCVRALYRGTGNPTLALESVLDTEVGGAPVAVVGVTASKEGEPTRLTAAWPLGEASDQAAILAVLQATGRTVSRWLTWEDASPRDESPDAQTWSGRAN